MTLIIYVGSQGSGKTTLAEKTIIKDKIIYQSKLVQEEVEARDLEWNHNNAHIIATDILSHDRYFFAKKILEEYHNGKLILDGTKNPEEISFLRENCDNVKVIGFYCPRDERFKRVNMRKREREYLTPEEFLTREINEIMDIGLYDEILKSDYFILTHHFKKGELVHAAKEIFDFFHDSMKTNIISPDIDVVLASSGKNLSKRYLTIQSVIEKMGKIYPRNTNSGRAIIEYFKLDKKIIESYRNDEVSMDFLLMT